MKPILQIAPLVLLLFGAFAVVWRGLRRKPDGSKNVEQFKVPGAHR